MNRNQRKSDFTAREAAFAERLREWDPARREAPPSDAEQLWFRERLLAEARAGENTGSPFIGGWVRIVAVVGALFLVTVSLVLLRRDPSPSGAQPAVEASGVRASVPELPDSEPGPRPETLSQTGVRAATPAVAPAPVAVAEVIPNAENLTARPSALDFPVEPVVSEPAVRARQLQMRGASGTRLLWTFDPDFELAEAGE